MSIIGIEKFYYAKITKDDSTGVTFGIPVYIPSIREISVKPKQNIDKIHAENILWGQDATLEEAEVGVEFVDIDNATLADMLGKTIVSTGGFLSNQADTAPYVAILYKGTKRNKKGQFGILYKGKFTLPDSGAKTKEGKTDYQTPKMTATFQPLQYSGDWQYIVDEDDVNCPTNINSTFFTSVLTPTASATSPIAVSTIVPADLATSILATTKPVITFNNAIVTHNVTVVNNTDGTIVAGVFSLDSTSKILTFTPSTNLTSTKKYNVVIAGVKDIYGQLLATTIKTFTVA